jgi:hypothetical protein
MAGDVSELGGEVLVDVKNVHRRQVVRCGAAVVNACRREVREPISTRVDRRVGPIKTALAALAAGSAETAPPE